MNYVLFAIAWLAAACLLGPMIGACIAFGEGEGEGDGPDRRVILACLVSAAFIAGYVLGRSDLNDPYVTGAATTAGQTWAA